MKEHRLMLSVAMCTYNGEKYIKEQIDSILNQVLSVDEIVICDDCSTDNTLEIAEKILSDTNIEYRIINNDKTLGVVKNFEKCTGLCSGDIIFLADQDDRWLPEKTKVMVKEFENPDVVLVFSDGCIINSNGTRTGRRLCYDKNYNSEKYSVKDFINNYTKKTPYGCMSAVRKTALDMTYPFIETSLYHDAWIAYSICMIGNVIYIPDDLIEYRVHEQSITQSTNGQSKWEDETKQVSEFDRRFDINKYRNDRCEIFKQVIERFPNSKGNYYKAFLRASRMHSRLLKRKSYNNVSFAMILLVSLIDGSYLFRNTDRNHRNTRSEALKLCISDIVYILKE